MTCLVLRRILNSIVPNHTCAFFAFVNLVVSFGSVGYAAFWMSYFIVFQDKYPRFVPFGSSPSVKTQYEPFIEGGLSVPVYIFAFILMCAIVALIFGTLLMVGIHKRIPNLIKAYLVYGIMVVIVCVTCDCIYFGILASYGYYSYWPFFSVLIVCALYTGMLIKIHRNYRTMRRELKLYYHMQLVEPIQSPKIFEE